MPVTAALADALALVLATGAVSTFACKFAESGNAAFAMAACDGFGMDALAASDMVVVMVGSVTDML